METIDKIDNFKNIFRNTKGLIIRDIRFHNSNEKFFSPNNVYCRITLEKGILAIAEEYGISLNREVNWDNPCDYVITTETETLVFKESEDNFYKEGGKDDILEIDEAREWEEEEMESI